MYSSKKIFQEKNNAYSPTKQKMNESMKKQIKITNPFLPPLKTFWIASLFCFLSVSTAFSQKIKIQDIEKQIQFYSERMRTSNRAFQFFALRKLSEIRHKKSVQAILPLLNSKDFLLRKKTAEVLEEMKFSDAVAPLIRRLKVEKDPWVQRQIILALGTLKDQRARIPLKPFLRNTRLSTRQATQFAIKSIESSD